jgi:hypothetical protein
MKPPTTSAPAPQLGTRPWLHVRTRAARVRPKSSRFFLRSDKLLLQNCAILHNAPQNGFVRSRFASRIVSSPRCVRGKVFHGRFYGRLIFHCKTAQPNGNNSVTFPARRGDRESATFGNAGGQIFRNPTSYEYFKSCNFLELPFRDNTYCSISLSCRARWRPHRWSRNGNAWSPWNGNARSPRNGLGHDERWQPS